MDPAGQETTYTHDALGRETFRSYASPATPLGDDLGSIATTRDPNGNPLVVTETYSGVTGTRVTERTYDDFGRLAEVSYPNGTRARHGYDATGRTATLESIQEEELLVGTAHTESVIAVVKEAPAAIGAEFVRPPSPAAPGRRAALAPDPGYKSGVRNQVSSSPGFVLPVGWPGEIRVVPR